MNNIFGFEEEFEEDFDDCVCQQLSLDGIGIPALAITRHSYRRKMIRFENLDEYKKYKRQALDARLKLRLYHLEFLRMRFTLDAILHKNQIAAIANSLEVKIREYFANEIIEVNSMTVIPKKYRKVAQIPFGRATIYMLFIVELEQRGIL